MAYIQITLSEIEELRNLNASGQVAEVWQRLGEKGDAYAFLAAVVAN